MACQESKLAGYTRGLASSDLHPSFILKVLYLELEKLKITEGLSRIGTKRMLCNDVLSHFACDSMSFKGSQSVALISLLTFVHGTTLRSPVLFILARASEF